MSASDKYSVSIAMPRRRLILMVAAALAAAGAFTWITTPVKQRPSELSPEKIRAINDFDQLQQQQERMEQIQREQDAKIESLQRQRDMDYVFSDYLFSPTR